MNSNAKQKGHPDRMPPVLIVLPETRLFRLWFFDIYHFHIKYQWCVWRDTALHTCFAVC